MYKIQDIVSELTLQLRLNISNILQTDLCTRESICTRESLLEKESKRLYDRERKRERERERMYESMRVYKYEREKIGCSPHHTLLTH